MLHKLTKYFQRSEFLRHTLMLMTGSSVAAAIPIAISPILTRLYTPEEFGIFAVFSVFVGFFSSFASLRYHVAIMLPESQDGVKHLVFLSSVLTTILSLILAVIVALWGEVLARLSGSLAIESFLFFLPVLLFFTGHYYILSHYLGRHKEYKYLAESKVYEAVTGSGGNVALGVHHAGVWGLIIGQVLGTITGCLWLCRKSFLLLKLNGNKLTYEKVKFWAKRYANFPKYDVASTAMGVLSANLHIILFSMFFGESIVGIITLATRIISKPLQIFTSSFSQVFYQRISSYTNREELLRAYTSGIKKLSFISISVIIIVLSLPDNLITWIFGSNWVDVAIYMKILTFLYCIQFVGSSVSTIYNVLEMQKFILWFQSIGTIITIATIGYGHYINLSDIATFQLYVAGKTLLYLYLIVHPYVALKIGHNNAYKNEN